MTSLPELSRTPVKVGAAIDIGGIGVRSSARIHLGCADDEVGISVGVDVTGAGDGPAKIVIDNGAFNPPQADSSGTDGRPSVAYTRSDIRLQCNCDDDRNAASANPLVRRNG